MQWGSNRHAAAGAAVLLMWADLAPTMQITERVSPQDARGAAVKQLHYIAGDNDRGSYVAGWGENPPQRNHHRNAACAPWEQMAEPGKVCDRCAPMHLACVQRKPASPRRLHVGAALRKRSLRHSAPKACLPGTVLEVQATPLRPTPPSFFRLFFDVADPNGNGPTWEDRSCGVCYAAANRPNKFQTHGALIGGPKTPTDAGSASRTPYSSEGWNDWRTDWVGAEQAVRTVAALSR